MKVRGFSFRGWVRNIIGCLERCEFGVFLLGLKYILEIILIWFIFC